MRFHPDSTISTRNLSLTTQLEEHRAAGWSVGQGYGSPRHLVLLGSMCCQGWWEDVQCHGGASQLWMRGSADTGAWSWIVLRGSPNRNLC